METANTILEQLGGKRFLIMTGSKNLRGSDNSLVMDLTRNKISAQYLTITLEADDTYTMLFQSMRKMEIKTKAEVKGIYADTLQWMFTYQTGLDTKL
jgi:hypothetical protein